jgi:predicted lipoprotein with Yx(FWY)xxD motif
MKTFLILLLAVLALAAAGPSCDAVCTDSSCKLADSIDNLTKYVASVASVVRALQPTTTTTTTTAEATTTAAATTTVPTTTAAAAASGSSGTKTHTTSPSDGLGHNKLDEFENFPLDSDVAFYKRECRRRPDNLLACSPHARKLKKDDNFAIAEAARLGFKLNIPKKTAKSANDYVVTALPKESALLKQLETLKEERAKAGTSPADVEAQIKAENEKKAAAAAEAAKIAAEKAAADAKAKAEADAKAKGLSDAEAKALADKAAADAKAKAEADAAAAAAAAKAKADKEAADRLAAAPKINLGNTPAGQALIAPNGRTLYFNTDPSDFCVDACKPHWPHLSPSVAAIGGAGVTCAFGTAVRPDGGTQLTANGKPLFFSIKDTAAGTSNGHNDGNGFVIAKC